MHEDVVAIAAKAGVPRKEIERELAKLKVIIR